MTSDEARELCHESGCACMIVARCSECAVCRRVIGSADRHIRITVSPSQAATVIAALDDAMSLDARYRPGTLAVLQELRRTFGA